MLDRTYVYIDGESHYVRSDVAWKERHGEEASLERLRYRDNGDDRLVLNIPEAKVFWTRRMAPGVQQVAYFTAATGDDGAMYDIRLKVRDFGLEPYLVKESKQLAIRRASALRNEFIIEKPKGVDISLAIRMLRESRHYDVCHLYTSDADFVPLIEEVKRRGKQVFVHGYASGLATHSPLLVVANRFYDLDKTLLDGCDCT